MTNLFIHIVKSFTQGEPDVFRPHSLFPMKQLGFIELALKARMVENNTPYRLLKSPRGLSRRVVPRVRLISAPRERMSDETEILT